MVEVGVPPKRNRVLLSGKERKKCQESIYCFLIATLLLIAFQMILADSYRTPGSNQLKHGRNVLSHIMGDPEAEQAVGTAQTGLSSALPCSPAPAFLHVPVLHACQGPS